MHTSFDPKAAPRAPRSGRFLRSRSAVLTIAAQAIIALAIAAPLATAGEEVVVDGRLHVRNGAAPAHGIETMELDELWRGGGEEGEVLFGTIIDALADEDGNVYLLDSQLSEVPVFAPDGSHLRTLSRQGSGPGESNRPLDMLFMADGDLGLVQTFPGKIIQVDRQGDPTGDLVPRSGDPDAGGFMVVIDAEQGGGNLVLSGLVVTPVQAEGKQIRTHFLASFDDEGREIARYEEMVETWDFADFKLNEKDGYFTHMRRFAVGPDGRVYAAPHRNRYVINVYHADGTPDRVIEREFDSWPRNERYRRFTQSVMDAQMRQFPFEVETSIEATEPDIRSLHVDAGGALWVESSRSNQDQPDGIMLTYDVFDGDGHFVRQLAVACDGDRVEDGLFAAGNDRMIRVANFLDAALLLMGGGGAGDGADADAESAAMEIVCYRIASGASGRACK